jgi:hypothetical protein
MRYETRGTSLRVTRYEFQGTAYEVRVIRDKLRGTSYEVQVTRFESGNLPSLQWTVNPWMDCRLGWYSTVGCHLSGGRGQ